MQAMILRKPSNTPVARLRTRTLPTAQVQKLVVTQPVNLRPLGNTVSLTVHEENPFAQRKAIAIYTQASGGMAKPDPMQRSRRSSFVPGLGGLGEMSLADEAYAAFNQTDPDARSMNREQYNASPKRTYWEGEVTKWRAQRNAQASAQSSANWSKVGDIFTTTVGAASNVASQVMQQRIAEANAKAAAAQAEIERTRSSAFASRLTDVSQYGAGMAARKNITIPLLVIGGGALAVALFLFLKKKRAAPAAA